MSAFHQRRTFQFNLKQKPDISKKLKELQDYIANAKLDGPSVLTDEQRLAVRRDIAHRMKGNHTISNAKPIRPAY